jgi:hypothetical protein
MRYLETLPCGNLLRSDAMKKMRLHLSDVDVESFSVLPPEEFRGRTVVAHVTDFQQTCQCGYTYDPFALDCVSYAEPCEASMVPTNCTPSEPTNYYCDSCRDSVTACGP